MQEEVLFKAAVPSDASEIVRLVRAISEYEKLEDRFKATEKSVLENVFQRGQAKIILVECQGKNVGYAIYCYNFSSFEMCKGLYLEDIFLLPEYRGKGIGKRLFDHIEGIARQEGCARMEWVCLNWNESALNFYRNRGVQSLREWTLLRKELR